MHFVAKCRRAHSTCRMSYIICILLFSLLKVLHVLWVKILYLCIYTWLFISMIPQIAPRFALPQSVCITSLWFLRLLRASRSRNLSPIFAYRVAIATLLCSYWGRVKRSLNHACASTCGLWLFDTWIIKKSPSQTHGSGRTVISYYPRYHLIYCFCSLSCLSLRHKLYIHHIQPI